MSYWRPLFLQLLVLLLLKWLTSASSSEPPPSANSYAKPGCISKCGNISNIPYPFGIGQGCHIELKLFNLTCNNSKLYYGYNGATQILNISLQGRLSVNTSLFFNWKCYNSSGLESSLRNWYVLAEGGSPVTIAYSRNKLTGIGCDTEALMRIDWVGHNENEIGCSSVCSEDWIMQDNPCSGVGCCQTEIPPGFTMSSVLVRSFKNHSKILGFNRCSYAFLIDKDHNLTAPTVLDLLYSRTHQQVPDGFMFPVALDWTIGNQTCSEAQKNQQKYACKSENSRCNDSKRSTKWRTKRGGSTYEYGLGYRCSCTYGYSGNPYLQL